MSTTSGKPLKHIACLSKKDSSRSKEVRTRQNTQNTIPDDLVSPDFATEDCSPNRLKREGVCQSKRRKVRRNIVSSKRSRQCTRRTRTLMVINNSLRALGRKCTPAKQNRKEGSKNEALQFKRTRYFT